MSQDIIKKIKNELDKVRPHLQMDGGDVKFVHFDEETGTLKLSLLGMCIGCPMNQITLQDGIGRVIMDNIPEVKKIVNK